MQLISSGISLDQKRTWPTKAIDLLFKNKIELKEYIKLEKQIDRKAETDVLLRIHRPYNQFVSTFQNVNNEVYDIFQNEDIVGYHCTRLIQDEIDEIISNGLLPLTMDLVKNKLDRLLNLKIISEYQYQMLYDNNQSNNSSRKNKVCLFHTQHTFKDYSGLYRLLGIWGGESIYWHHEIKGELIKSLCKIGEPCIVVCKIPANDIITRYDIINRIINYYITRKPFEDFDSLHEHQIKVERIIKRNDALFEKLTDYSQWKNELNT